MLRKVDVLNDIVLFQFGFFYRMDKILIIFLLICTILVQSVESQNGVQLGNASSGLLEINPGFAGSVGSINVIAIRRQQWVGFEGAPATTVVGVDKEIKFGGNFHGIGASVVYDVIGAYSTAFINANYSYHIEIENGLIGLGLKMGVINSKISSSELTTTVDGQDDDYHQKSDEAIPTSDDSGIALDVGFGAFCQTQKFYLGLSCLHLNQPSPTFKNDISVKYRPLFMFNGGYKYDINKKIVLESRVLLKTDFAAFQFDINCIAAIKERYWFGLGYRYNDAIPIQVGLNLTNGLSVGYSYEVNISPIHSYNSGSHELTIGYVFDLDIEKRTKRYKSVRFL